MTTDRWTPETLEQRKRDNPDFAKANPMPAIKKLSPETMERMRKEVGIMSTHHARRTYSELCQRNFDSKAEAEYGERLCLMERAGEINHLRYQVKFELFDKPRITITIDFAYIDNPGEKQPNEVFVDVKGKRFTKKRRTERPRVERDFWVKLHWLKQRYNVDVKLVTD